MPDSPSQFPPGPSPDPNKVSEPERWTEILQQADRASYQLLAIEVWAIAKTMDTIVPGFWSRFMANRQVALKQFLERKQNRQASQRSSSPEG
ncbi:MAG: hypothetical protein SFW36_09655 [Leptolyngbyaceae cyanobacterium bins.59]|nr:hypothetical protein [Leptolyngbyaceae cyanobacterium bins.59]